MSTLHTRTKRRARSRGFTAVEVLMAMTLFAIGAAGVIGMQRVTIQGGEDARRFDVATNIANEWIGRLQRDAMFWTQPNASNPNTIDIANTKWLNNVGGACSSFCNIPMPVGVPDGQSPAFDNYGKDLPAGTNDAWYCVQYRLNWLQSPGPIPGGPFQLGSVMRAEVRVYWALLESDIIHNCAAPPPDPIPLGSQFHFVYAATAIRENALR